MQEQDPSTSVTGSANPSNGADCPQPSSSDDEACPDQTVLSARFQNYYSFSQPYRNPNHSKGPCIRTIVVIMISVIIVISALLFVIWWIRSPRLPEVRVDSLSVTNLSTFAQSITGIWHVGLVFLNANNMKTTYHHVHSSIYYKSKYLTETLVSPFKESEGGEVTIHITLSLISSYVDEWIAHDITEDRAKGKVRFDIKVRAKIGFKGGAWRTITKRSRVYCSDVPVEFPGNSTSGALVDGAVYCEDK